MPPLNPHSAVLALMTKDFHTFTVGKISVPTLWMLFIFTWKLWAAFMAIVVKSFVVPT
ncbi:hypothetical protein OSCI_940008 [Kamptonema sp. PCC 6506]|uniref:hypothetical protein n=1 Tax=Kamptonema formosum TaxID=331992 RepID=UPI0001DACD3D|nr:MULTISPECIES: hypothetical protein [Kamptonema]CBN54523.1 hypothetical protein OSCI_940008 [Kamptonema sp. PCC 6506]